MIFQATWQQMLDGTKWESRRIVKPGETALHDISAIQGRDDVTLRNENGHLMVVYPMHLDHLVKITVVLTATGRVKWRVGNMVAIQPGRGMKALGSRNLLEIRQERLQDITQLSAKAEGVQPYLYPMEQSLTPRGIEQGGYLDYIKPYRLLWNTIHTKRGDRWDDNPEVWVLRFELVEATE